MFWLGVVMGIWEGGGGGGGVRQTGFLKHDAWGDWCGAILNGDWIVGCWGASGRGL